MFHRNNKHLGTSNMFNNYYKSVSQKFIEIYQSLEKENAENSNQEQLYKEAIEVLRRDKDIKKETEQEEPLSLSSAFKEAKSNQIKEMPKVDVTNIFKD